MPLAKIVTYFQHAGKNSLVVTEKSVLVLSDLDGGTTELGDQDLVTGGDGGGDAFAVLGEGAGADGQDGRLVQLLDGGFGQEDTACCLCFGFNALDQDAVEEGREGLDGLCGDGGLAGC